MKYELKVKDATTTIMTFNTLSELIAYVNAMRPQQQWKVLIEYDNSSCPYRKKAQRHNYYKCGLLGEEHKTCPDCSYESCPRKGKEG